MKIAILGSGGHARSVAGVVIEELKLNVIAFVDLQASDATQEKIYNISVQSGKPSFHEKLKAIGAEGIVFAIGDNGLREKIYLELKGKYLFPNIISTTSVIKKTVKMGEANVFFPFSYVGPEAVIGDNNIINTRATIEHECKIGSSNHFSPSSTVLGRVTVGNLNFICAAATVIPSVKIENGVTLGANSVATRDLPSPGVYVGAPAQLKTQAKGLA